jgi:hypothetical protein
MKPFARRLLIKAALLSLVANGAFLFSQYKENGYLGRHDYRVAAGSLAITLVVLFALVSMVSRFLPDRFGRRRG